MSHPEKRLLLPLLLWALTAVATLRCSGEPAPPAVESGLRDLNGTQLFVKTMGRGEPLVIVHGGPVLEHGYLLPHLEPLAESHRLIFYDQRLSGRSSADIPGERVRLDEFVADLEALRQSEGLDRFHLLAHSWGGLIAMKYAVAHADRLESMVLVGPMPATFQMWQTEEAELNGRLTPEDLAARQAVVTSESFANKEASAYQELYRISFGWQFHRRELAQNVNFYIAPDLEERSRRFSAIMPDLAGYDLQADLAGVEVPVLLLYGADEPAVQSSGPLLQGTLPRAEMVVVAEAGHFPFVEQPTAFLGAVGEFLANR